MNSACRSTIQALAREIKARLETLQFGEPEATSRYLLIPQDEYGFGAQVHRRVLGLKLGYMTNRTVVFEKEDYGPYLACFEPTSRLQKEDLEVMKAVTLDPEGQQTEPLVYWDFESSWADQPAFWRLHDWVPEEFRALGLDFQFLEGLILQRLRVLPEFAQEIEAICERIGFSHPVIGVHIRRGDKSSEAPYVPLRKYNAEILAAVKRTGICKVFVTSDDPDVFSDLPDQERIEYIYDKEEPRYNNANHLLIQENSALRRQETLTALKIYELLRRCDFIVGQDNAHLTNLAVSRRVADLDGENRSCRIPGDYTMHFRKADLADWVEVLLFRVRRFRRKYKLPGLRTMLSRALGRPGTA
jgi:hypothetical protein